MSRWRAAATATDAVTAATQPQSRCALPPRFALLPPPLLPPPSLRCRQASADIALARCRHCQRCAVALPPPPLTLPLLLRHRQAAADVALSRCRQRRSLHAVTTALPPLRCAPLPRFALPPPPCHRRTAAKIPPTSRSPLLIVIFQYYSIYVILNEVMY